MSNATVRGVLLGVIIAAAVVAAAWYATELGYLTLPADDGDPSRFVLVLEVPDQAGVPVAGLVFEVDAQAQKVSVLDPYEESATSGTSARNAREALPFGGGAAVRAAVALQLGAANVAWVSVQSSDWAEIVDACGEIEVSVPVSTSSFVNGELHVFSEGPNTLGGAGAVALAGALDQLPDTVRADVYRQLAAGVGTCLLGSGSTVPELVASGVARSSLPADSVPTLRGAR